MVMRIIDEFPNIPDRKIAARIYPLGPKPEMDVPEKPDDKEDEAQAKVVRTPHRKGPRTTVEDVHSK
jgi:hypothetical protein